MIENESVLEEYMYEAEHYGEILRFYQMGDFETFEIEPMECEYNDKEIVFVFGYDFNDANESNTQSTTANHVIVYDRVLEEFTSHEYEQG